jgi:hypothetical protein
VWGGVADQNIFLATAESQGYAVLAFAAALWRRNELPNAAGYKGVLCVCVCVHMHA